MQNFELNENAVFSLSSEYLLYRGKDGESDFFIFNIADGKVFKLNASSYAMIETFDGKRRLSEVVAVLQKRFDISPDQLSSDLFSLLRVWVDKKILFEKDAQI